MPSTYHQAKAKQPGAQHEKGRVASDDSTTARYLYDPFRDKELEPSPAEHKRTLDWQTLWSLAQPPQ